MKGTFRTHSVKSEVNPKRGKASELRKSSVQKDGEIRVRLGFSVSQRNNWLRAKTALPSRIPVNQSVWSRRALWNVNTSRRSQSEVSTRSNSPRGESKRNAEVWISRRIIIKRAKLPNTLAVLNTIIISISITIGKISFLKIFLKDSHFGGMRTSHHRENRIRRGANQLV